MRTFRESFVCGGDDAAEQPPAAFRAVAPTWGVAVEIDLQPAVGLGFYLIPVLAHILLVAAVAAGGGFVPGA